MKNRDDFMKLCNLENQTAKFTMDVDFEDLYNIGGIGGLNDLLETEVEDGYLLEDISYDAIKLVEKNCIQIEVFVADIRGWIENGEELTSENSD